jgi:hypothetical protein
MAFLSADEKVFFSCCRAGNGTAGRGPERIFFSVPDREIL